MPSRKFGPELKGNHNGTEDVRATSGSCFDVIDKTCIEKLTEKATALADEADGNVCTMLERGSKSTSLDGCNGFAGNGGKLGNFAVKLLGDLDAPKSDQLMEIASITALWLMYTLWRDYSATALYDEAYKITPVLTVFTANDNSSLVDRTASQLTCLRAVTVEDPIDDEDSSENSAVAVKASGVAPGIAVLTGIFALL